MGNLAITGGTPVMDTPWKKNWPIITDEDIAVVTEVLRSARLGGGAGGPQALALEQEWAEHTGTKHALAVTSGTAALHCAVAALELEPGDEVIIPAYTFVASAMAVLHHNAIPIFADVRPDTYCIDVNDIRERLSPKTRAIMPVHVYGQPADMDEILALAEEFGLAVIEDACQAHGAVYKGRRVGSIGDVGAFSLQTTKNLMCGEGGLITTNSDELRQKAALCRIFGEHFESQAARDYNSLTVGWNYRIADMNAALARTQLRHMDDYNAVNRRNSEYLTGKIGSIAGVFPPFIADDRESVFYGYAIKVDPAAMGIDEPVSVVRRAFEQALTAEGIPAGQWQTMPVPAQRMFQELKAYGGGCPWSCPHARAGIRYDVAEYPIARQVVDGLVKLDEVRAPNDLRLMDKIAEVIARVAEHITEAIDFIKKDR